MEDDELYDEIVDSDASEEEDESDDDEMTAGEEGFLKGYNEAATSKVKVKKKEEKEEEDEDLE